MRLKQLVCLLVSVIALAGFAARRERQPYVFPKPVFFPPMPVSALNPVTQGGAELGRFLFYDPILSADSSISCASCHRQSAAFSDGPVATSKGINGTLQKRNTLPLFNLAWHSSLSWDGRAASIEAQVFHPVREAGEMSLPWRDVEERINRSAFYVRKFQRVFGNKPIDSTLIAYAIAQFERTLLSYRSKYDQVLNHTALFTKDEAEGFVLMNDMTKGDCLHCHTTDSDPLGSTFEFSNNGLDSVTDAVWYKDKGRGAATGVMADHGKFKIPSLRNIALTAPYMHDGRFATLEEVMRFYSDGVNVCANIDSKMGFARSHGVHLSPDEQRKIIAFLHTLTDSFFISDPRYGNPFAAR